MSAKGGFLWRKEGKRPGHGRRPYPGRGDGVIPPSQAAKIVYQRRFTVFQRIPFPAGNPSETPKNLRRPPVKNAALGQRGEGGKITCPTGKGDSGKVAKVLVFPLAIFDKYCYNKPEKQKSGSLRERQLPETCPGEQSTYTTATRPHRKMIIPFFHPVCKRDSYLSTGTIQPSFFLFSWKTRITFAG